MSVWADEKLPVLKAGGNVYSNVTVLTVTVTDVYFTYNNGKGMANAKLKNLNPELQKHFHYNPVKAGEAEQKQAQANAEYHKEIASAPAASPPPDESRVRSSAVAHASGLNWSTDFSRALAQARVDNKMVLLDFTGPIGVRGASNLTMMCCPLDCSPPTPEPNWNWYWWIFRAQNPKTACSNKLIMRLSTNTMLPAIQRSCW